MVVTLSSVVIDAAEIEPESAFWHRLLGGSITRTPTHHFIQVADLPVIVVQAAAGHLPPDWPDGTSQQMHLDLTVDDLLSADRTALDAGAIRLRPTGDAAMEPRTGSAVYASPAGHPFCLRSV
ncbi:VOC family protein [Streptomyces sp. NPDC001904]|uniref:VOC family protein n=1 Tax=Streptomyces sp. NPDC001904 TaxID=3154531 RepID=UPI00333141C4